MPANSRKPKQFSVGVYDRQHLRNLSARLRKVQALIDEAAAQATRIAVRTGYTDTTKDFRFDDFPQARREIDLLIGELASSLASNVREASSDAWGEANAKNDAMVDFMLASSGVEMSRKATRPWYNKNTRALNAFLHRQEEGMELSRNVWRLDDFKTELELALEMGLGRGKAAAELSRDVRSFLKHPDKLFRRVRDEKGNLRLSRAAADFHPGQGVYRSSYKNALRLTASETNMAYRSADSKRWQQIDFVLGQHIEPSKNHPIYDICDELQGDYPKDFIFIGWHPFCKCFAVPKLPTVEEFLKYQQTILDGEDVSEWDWGGEVVEDVPGGFKSWVEENTDRISRAKSLPYFIKDNPDYAGLGDIAPQIAKPKTPQEIAAERHAARTQQQADDIRQRWADRYSIEAKAYFAHKRTWKHSEDYVLEKTEKRLLTGGKSRDCDVYRTIGGTEILVPKRLNRKNQKIKVADLVSKLEALPVELKALAKKIELLDYYNPADPYWRKKYKNFTHSFATGGSGTIAFYRCNTMTEQEVSDYLLNTLAHENGHTFDHKDKVKGNRLIDKSLEVDWQKAIISDKKVSGRLSPTDYGENAYTEDFAESCAMLIEKPEEFKKNFPGRFAILKRLLRL